MLASEGERRDFARRLGLFYGALFVLYGVQLPYLPVWLDWRGLSPQEIGLVSSLPLIIRLFATPSLAMAADRGQSHRRIVVLLAWIGLASSLLLPFAHGLWSILALVIVLLVAMPSTMPLAETVAMTGVRLAKLDYGRMRLWGSITFIVMNIAGGWALAAWGADVVVVMVVLGCAATVMAAHLLPAIPVAQAGGQTRIALPAAKPRPRLAETIALVSERRVALFLIAAGATQASHAVFYAFGVIHWRAQGLSAGTIGTLWAIGVVIEVALFAVSGRVVALAGAVGLLVLGGAAALVRWSVMAFDPALWVLVALQLMHGVTFGATHLGAMHVIERIVPPTQAGSAQALHATVTSGVAMGLALYLAGRLYGPFGGASYLAMAALGAIGLGAALQLGRALKCSAAGPLA